MTEKGVIDKKTKEIANRLASENIRVLYSFASKHSRRWAHLVGGHAPLVGELSVAFMMGIYAWIDRKPEFEAARISTYIWNSLKWDLRALLSRVAFVAQRNVSSPKVIPVFHFHGTEADRDDLSLSVDDHAGEFDKFLDSEVMRRKVDELLSSLKPRQRAVLSRRMFHGETLVATGLHLCISKERVRQIEAGAIRDISAPAEQAGLGEFVRAYDRPRPARAIDKSSYTDAGPVWDDLVRAYDEDR